jgi:hypothetical protein
LIFQFLNAFEFLFFFFKSLFFFGIFFGFLPPFDRFSGDPFGIRVKALSLEPLDPYTLAVRAEEGSWGAGKLELDAQRFAQRVAKKNRIYIYIICYKMSLGYIRMLLRGTFHTRPTCAWEIVTMPLAIVIRCSDVTCLGGRKLAAYYKDAKTISYIHTHNTIFIISSIITSSYHSKNSQDWKFL